MCYNVNKNNNKVKRQTNNLKFFQLIFVKKKFRFRKKEDEVCNMIKGFMMEVQNENWGLKSIFSA